MAINDLPKGSSPKTISYPAFPTRWQLLIWRNWGLVEASSLAKVLDCSVDNITAAAEQMGLNPNVKVDKNWLQFGYLTIIRNNWHLLNYPQLLDLLGWSSDKLALSLKEEDFLYFKLGNLKPECPTLKYSPLTNEEIIATNAIKERFDKYFNFNDLTYIEEPFSFKSKFAAKDNISGTEKFDFNFIHSYCASCGDVLGEAQELDPVPENLLAQYQSMGIKGVWIHAILYLLCPIPGAEEFSTNWQLRLDNLKKIVEKCAKYDIKVYLYVNEPRCLPKKFYDLKPHWKGIPAATFDSYNICTTATKEPLEWLENAVNAVFTYVPSLGGLLTITASENPTTCHSRFESHKCPSCKNVLPEKIIADVNCAIERGMHKASKDAKLIMYDWAWTRTAESTPQEKLEFKKEVLKYSPKGPNVYVNCVSEWGLITHVGGVEQYLMDYSISQVGPSGESTEVWKFAQSLGIGTVAKLQLNNSWELSAVPSIPVPYLIKEHLDNLAARNVNGVMLSWTLGGYPGGNLDLLKATPEEIANSKFNNQLANKVCSAWNDFSQAFRNFPFNVEVIYNSPVNYGPMNLLHLEKTNYKASMVGFPYDDLTTWRNMYPEDIFEDQFKKLTLQWKAGLDTLQDARSLIKNDKELQEFEEIYVNALAAYCHLNSTYLQICFVRARDNSFDKTKMIAIAKEEIQMAKILMDIVRKDSRIGFEASNHYYYTLNDLAEKVITCQYIIDQLS